MNFTFRLTQKAQLFLTVALISLCTVSIAVLQQSILNQNKQSATEEEYFRQEQVRATSLNIINNFPDFGFKNLIADWIYLQFIQYYGDTEARKVTGYQLIPQYFQAIVERDPRFTDAHILLSLANTLFAGKPELSVELLEQSLEHLAPNQVERSHELWFNKAMDEFLFLGKLEAAKQSYQKGAEWAEQSTEEGSDDFANYAKRMIRFIETNPDTTEGRIGAWTLILSTTNQRVVQEKVIQELEALGAEVVISSDGSIERVKLPRSE